MVKIGGFDQETPRGVLEQAWAEHIRPRVQDFYDTSGLDVRAPYMLSSQLWVRFSSFSEARNFLAALRRNDITFDMNNKSFTIWGTLQKPKEVRERNRRLLRITEYLEQHICQGVKVHPKTFQNICWRSGTIVIADRRIARISTSSDGSFKLEWSENWFDTNVFRGAAAQMENAAQKLMSDMEL